MALSDEAATMWDGITSATELTVNLITGRTHQVGPLLHLSFLLETNYHCTLLYHRIVLRASAKVVGLRVCGPEEAQGYLKQKRSAVAAAFHTCFYSWLSKTVH